MQKNQHNFCFYSSFAPGSKLVVWNAAYSGMSKRAGGGNAMVTRGLCAKLSRTYQPVVEASKKDKWLQSYDLLAIILTAPIFARKIDPL